METNKHGEKCPLTKQVPEENNPVTLYQNVPSASDMAELHRLGELPPNRLFAEIREIYEEAYQLSIQEAKELARGKNLAIFKKKKPSS